MRASAFWQPSRSVSRPATCFPAAAVLAVLAAALAKTVLLLCNSCVKWSRSVPGSALSILMACAQLRCTRCRRCTGTAPRTTAWATGRRCTDVSSGRPNLLIR